MFRSLLAMIMLVAVAAQTTAPKPPSAMCVAAFTAASKAEDPMASMGDCYPTKEFGAAKKGLDDCNDAACTCVGGTGGKSVDGCSATHTCATLNCRSQRLACVGKIAPALMAQPACKDFATKIISVMMGTCVADACKAPGCPDADYTSACPKPPPPPETTAPPPPPPAPVAGGTTPAVAGPTVCAALAKKGPPPAAVSDPTCNAWMMSAEAAPKMAEYMKCSATSCTCIGGTFGSGCSKAPSCADSACMAAAKLCQDAAAKSLLAGVSQCAITYANFMNQSPSAANDNCLYGACRIGTPAGTCSDAQYTAMCPSSAARIGQAVAVLLAAVAIFVL